ncbi:TetR family transcriptional regulator [Aeromicrobium sp. CF3.5]|uniref:TetR family transcriptional regulator n=1 Tax=Aeromicrobium sp. CF3.5 TaxID=3373078 RepID=UPI003EE753DE
MAAPLQIGSPDISVMRRRLLDTALQMTAARGWGSITMGRLASEARVSRQTVYNEIGTKPALAEAMVLDELSRFLAVVDRAFDDHSDDVIHALRAAVHDVLTMAQGNPLLQAVASATHGAETDLLPLLTTHAGPLLEIVTDVVQTRVAAHDTGLDDDRLATIVDVIVRYVLSHVMQDPVDPDQTADGLAWIAQQVLRR